MTRSRKKAVCQDNRLRQDLRNLLYAGWLRYRGQEILQSFGPDVIYERYSLFGISGLQLARRLDVPLILEVNAPLVLEQSQQRGLCLSKVAAMTEQMIVTAADHVIVVSSWLSTHVAELGVDPGRITVMPNAADPQMFCPDTSHSTIRDDLNWQGEFVVGFAGSMKPWHGVSTLLEAMSVLNGSGDAFRLLLVGDGPETASLKQQTHQLGLSDRVHFTGKLSHDQVPGAMAAMDVAVAPYAPSAEAYFSPVKLFEYMLMARPTVAARLGQTAQIIDHEQSGWLYAPGDSAELADRLRWLWQHPAAARRAGAVAQKLCLAQHTWQHNALRVIEIAENLLHPSNEPMQRQPAGFARSSR